MYSLYVFSPVFLMILTRVLSVLAESSMIQFCYIDSYLLYPISLISALSLLFFPLNMMCISLALFFQISYLVEIDITELKLFLLSNIVRKHYFFVLLLKF